MPKIILTTHRLYLVHLDASHSHLVANYFKQNRVHFREGMPLLTDEFIMPKHQEKLLLSYEALMEKNLLRKFWLFLKEDNLFSEIIGDIGFSGIVQAESFLSCHVGYKLNKNHTHKGYMQEALKAAVDYAFIKMKMHRIEANIRPMNVDSIKLIEKLGFQKEGLSPEFLKINGKWEDHFRYALINHVLDSFQTSDTSKVLDTLDDSKELSDLSQTATSKSSVHSDNKS